ncbi:MAG TPA: WcbI family polysaccharide biosynthesis putative acetyltransferase [Stellaceae bacterium]|nr:WcbI family polysaccharide biosynthesis putative acetyltransferase [Stellaceae bacterium]
MPDDIANQPPARPRATHDVAACRSHWQLLGQLESTAIGRRAADGAVAVRRRDAAGCFLYGPYLHLAAGRYRLAFRCESGAPRMAAQPVLGVEIIVLSRFQQAWRDFTAAELSSGAACVDFAVPEEHSLAGGNEGRFEFRFFHFGNADLLLTAVELERLPPEIACPAQPRRWRLLGRLQKGWLGRRAGDGSVSVRRFEPPGRLLYGGWPYLRLPRGGYRLIVDAQTGVPRRPGAPALEVEVLGQSRWRSRRPTRLPRRPEALGEQQARRLATAEEIAAGPLALDFVVPSEMALEAGADAPFEVRLNHLGNAALDIRAVDLLELGGDELPAPRASAAPRPRASAKRKIVLIGNCQCETLRQGFAHVEALNRRFEVKYHFVQLPRTLHEFAARDLESCDVLLIQDTRLWDAFPLRDCVRPGAEVLRFPPVRFTSPWPFDAWNGPGDRAAHAREAPNLTFPYLDGLLGRLRGEIPDKEARFRAYRSLTCPGVVNYRRLHELEMRRLAATDKKYAITIGDFISGNFANRQIFHTTVRPNWEIFGQLLRFVARLVGVREPIALPSSVDAALRNPQIPVHPKVARDLGIGWADERTRYLNRGRAMTWEAYIRSYIEHYG